MILARVHGPVVSTIKHPRLAGLTVFVVQPVDLDGQLAVGPELLAVDHAQAGPGDLVVVMREGNGIRQVLGDDKSPVQALIVGVVDAVDRTAPDALSASPAASAQAKAASGASKRGSKGGGKAAAA